MIVAMDSFHPYSKNTTIAFDITGGSDAKFLFCDYNDYLLSNSSSEENLSLECYKSDTDDYFDNTSDSELANKKSESESCLSKGKATVWFISPRKTGRWASINICTETPRPNMKKNTDLYSGPVQASKTAVTKSQTSTGADAKTSKDKMNKGIVKVLNLLKIEFPDKKEAELMSAIKMYREKKGRLSNIPISTVVDDVKNIVNYTKMKPIKVPELNYPEMIRNRSVVNKPLTSSSMPVMPPPTPKTGPTMAPWANKSSNSERQALNWTAPVKENQCSVCIEKLTEKSAYRVDCGHLFHLPCIKMWLKKQSNCPVCRQHLLLPDEYPSLS